MLQVRPATLDAHSGALCKVLDHSANLFLWDPSDVVSDGCLEFPECLNPGGAGPVLVRDAGLPVACGSRTCPARALPQQCSV